MDQRTENPIVALSVTMDMKLDDDGIQRLHNQLSHFGMREVEVASK